MERDVNNNLINQQIVKKKITFLRDHHLTFYLLKYCTIKCFNIYLR